MDKQSEEKIRNWVKLTWLLGPGVFTLQQWLTLSQSEQDTILNEALSLDRREQRRRKMDQSDGLCE